MAEMPYNTSLAGRQSKLKEANALRAYAEKEPIPLKSENTINGHIGKLGQVFNFAVRNGMMHFNPTTECLRGRAKSTAKREQDVRSVFDDGELRNIFSASWYKAGKGTDKNWRPYQYWIPLLGLLTGCRINELAQLYLEDVKRTESGTWYLDINQNHSDQSLKTVNSIRVMPLHQRMVELGLPLYVETLRDLGEKRLFPELRFDLAKGYGKAAGAWFNERFLGNKLAVTRDGRKTFHSFRHGYITALERLDTPERVVTQLAGHERGTSVSAKRYAKDRDPDLLAVVVNAVTFDFLSEITPLDIESATAALKVAERRKTSKRRERLNPKKPIAV
jgi:integrase